MTYAPTTWDFVVLGVLLASCAVDPLLVIRIKAAIASGKHPNARLWLYRWWLALTWGFTLAVLALWIAYGRPWSALWFGALHPLRFGVGLLVAGGYLWYMLRARRRILANPEKFPRYRERLESVSILAARTPQERRLFPFLAITAGIGEEILLRGFVLSLFASLFGLWIGALANVVIFGLGHAYQGWAGIVRTGIFGAIATILVLATGSLVPAILVHAIQDLVAGDICARIFAVDASRLGDSYD
jgi:uncharacterized protein